MKIKKLMTLTMAVALSIGILGGCGTKASAGQSFTILEGQFSEINILGKMVGILIDENTDLTVKYHDSMNTVAAGNAVEKKEVDMYISYDGTLLTTLLGYDPSDVPIGQDLFVYASNKGIEDRGLMLTSKFGFENTYALGVKQELADAKNLTTISDLKPVAEELVFGAEHEFFDEEGTMRYNPFKKYYAMDFKDGVSLDIGLKYAAIDNNNIDVTMVYSTDGLNQKSGLKILKDDKSFFPQYYGAVLHRASLFEEYKDSAPNLKDLLLSLEGKITNEEMIAMNYAVDAEGKQPAEVAKAFLVEKGLSK